MGHEVVYCYQCQVRLTEADFQSGVAFRVGHVTTCDRCADALLPPMSPEEIMAVLNPEPLPGQDPSPRIRRWRRRLG
jgi:hypothetical protein